MIVVDEDVACTADRYSGAVLQLLAAFTAQDRAAIETLLDPACVWRVPGDNALAGEYVGRDKVMALFGVMKRLFNGPARFEVIDVRVEEDRATVHQYADVEMGGRALRLKETLIIRFADGHVVEVDEVQDDQAAFDRAFSRATVAALLRR